MTDPVSPTLGPVPQPVPTFARLRRAVDGWKTHAAAAAAVGIAIACYRTHVLTGPETYDALCVAVLGSANRAAIAKAR